MKNILFSLVAILLFGESFGQGSLWNRIDGHQVTTALVARDAQPKEYLLYALNFDALKAKLATAPARSATGPISNVVVAFPNPQGVMQNFRVYEASVLHPELAARHPEIQSYVGLGLEDKTAMIRFSVTLFGLHTMTFSGVNGTSYIDPYSKDLKNYIVYSRSALTRTRSFSCGTIDDRPSVEEVATGGFTNRASNSLFKTYRLALACTIEYAAFHVNAAGLGSGTLAQKKAAVLAAMTVTMTRVNGVYERDMAVTMVMVPNEESIINITTDNYDDSNANNILLSQNQTEVDNIIGSANYDIGHVCSTGGGGVASLGCVCTSIKAQGVTGSPAPVGDAYDIDYVAHEMGHQFGASHTFNSAQGSCGGGNRSSTSAFEPGSGTTIMAYAGICPPDDVQPHSDAYFHARSLISMMALVNGTANCAVAVANGNTPPVVSAGANYTIPYGTAFALTGSATDVDNDALTYCWEQYNFGTSTTVATAATTVGPNFRTFNPSASPTRYFPVFSSVLANNLVPTWEVVPGVARTLTFSLVVRDNRSPLGGQTQRATMNVIVANTGPFKVTSQSTPTAWAQNSSQTVTWDVAGTDANNINTTLVNIKLSIDGGVTFPYLLAANTPNDGTETITAPDVVSQNCRILIESVGNVFYAVNSKTFSIGYQIVTACNTYNYNTPFNLADGATTYTVKQINVPTAGTISDVNITINATHPNLQNLVIGVIRPGGALSTLFNQQCAGNADMNVTFDSQGAAFACASPTTGTYAPPTGFSLDTFNGNNQQGNWQFGFKDVVAGNAGSINSIALEVCSQTLVLLSNESFGFDNFALYPNPNSGKFTVQFDASSNAKVGILVHDIQGRKIFDKSYTPSGIFNQEVQLEDAQAGVYLVTITNGDKKMVKRIVIQ